MAGSKKREYCAKHALKGMVGVGLRSLMVGPFQSGLPTGVMDSLWEEWVLHRRVMLCAGGSALGVNTYHRRTYRTVILL